MMMRKAGASVENQESGSSQLEESHRNQQTGRLSLVSANHLKVSARPAHSSNGNNGINSLPDDVLLNVLQRIGCGPLPQTRSPGQNPSRYLWRHLHRIPPRPNLTVTTPLLSALVCKRWRAIADLAVLEFTFLNHDASDDTFSSMRRFPNLTRLSITNVSFPTPTFACDLAETALSLEVLELENCHCREGERFANALAAALPSWAALRRLSLGRVLCGVDHAAVLNLLNSVPSAPALEDFGFSLNDCDEILEEINDALGEMSRLRSLSLGVQDLWFGHNFARLISLINLSIEDGSPSVEDATDMCELRASIAELPLETLRVANTCMDVDFPEHIAPLPRLRVLKVEDVGYWKGCFPESLAKLTSLEELHLQSLHLIDDEGDGELIPDSIAGLDKLRVLKIVDCPDVRGLPQTLGSLGNLQELWLDGCVSLTALPESVGKLSSLRVLRLSGCHGLDSIPKSIASLAALQELRLSGGVLSSALSEGLGLLGELRVLVVVGCCHLEALPESVGRLQKLRELTVGDCPVLRALPESMGQLGSLRVLRVHRCAALERLPRSLGDLQRLWEVEVTECVSLREVPDALVQSLEVFSVKLVRQSIA